ncbi:gpi anchored [Pyrenophora seminiperda CCB06]|uniref:Gpi anchored n=1 Tax=Pyrenophora seminiperda CCB06 TaxID=1302712 RepID=A0A3M7MFL9_9PLEO|nr:gpi anchored [Pyrenophora seminiperda CCB06]
MSNNAGSLGQGSLDGEEGIKEAVVGHVDLSIITVNSLSRHPFYTYPSPHFTTIAFRPNSSNAKMFFTKLSILSGLAAVAVAEITINVDNIPTECKDVCSQVAGISNGCKTDSNDQSAATKCVCSANNASNLIPLCSACIGKFKSDKSKDDDSAVSSYLSECSLKTTAYNAAAISAVATDTVRTTSTDVVSKTSVAIIITSTSTQKATSNPAPTKTAGAAIGLGALGFALGML